MGGRGRPRRAGANEAILEAARALLFEHGLAGFSVEDVAQRAGVGRQSVYRRWATKPTLAIASVIPSADADDAYPDRGSFEADLRAGLEAVRSLYEQSDPRVFADVYGAMASDAGARELFADHYLHPRRRSLGRAVERGIERGELRADTDVEIIGDLVSGPFLHRLLSGTEGFDDELVDAIVGSVVAWCSR